MFRHNAASRSVSRVVNEAIYGGIIGQWGIVGTYYFAWRLVKAIRSRYRSEVSDSVKREQQEPYLLMELWPKYALDSHYI